MHGDDFAELDHDVIVSGSLVAPYDDFVLGELVARGASADIHAYGVGLVVKLFHPQYAHIAPIEAQRAAAVHDAGVSSPAVHDIVDLDGRPGIVFDRVGGPTLLDLALGDGSTRHGVATRLARLHAAIHSISVPTLPSWREFVAGVSPELFDPLPDGDRLYHGDFHPGNVIVGEQGEVVVDWPNACLGHPAADVARSIVLMRYRRGGAAYEPGEQARRREFADAYVAAYLTHGVVEPSDVQRCLPLHAAGMLRAEPGSSHSAELERLASGDHDEFLSGL